MTCKTCIQLEEAVAKANRPDPIHTLQGLSEAGMRNRAWQREEQKLKAEINLEKHQRGCPEHEDRPVFQAMRAG